MFKKKSEEPLTPREKEDRQVVAEPTRTVEYPPRVEVTDGGFHISIEKEAITIYDRRSPLAGYPTRVHKVPLELVEFSINEYRSLK